ncbi:MAG: NAD(+)/NADH kinase [Desulfuromonadales bacterium]|nr:NAD(+)/NADH kinase [Desulfuromonadales bacterium]
MNEKSHDISVGIIANPAAGSDIRRMVSAASGFSIAEKANIVRRFCLGMRTFGVTRAYVIPDQSGIAGSLIKQKKQGEDVLGERWPELEFLDMRAEDKAADTLAAVDLMIRKGVRLIGVLGGDGTHRLVAKNCGNTPMVALSTGTNNAFPQFQEATIAGIAAGLVASHAIPMDLAAKRNKVLRIAVDGETKDLALVDLCLTRDIWVGSRAIWKPEKVKDIFVTFAEADAIGLSSVAGLTNPIPRDLNQGLHLVLCPPGMGIQTLYAPIAPGLILPVGIAEMNTLNALEVKNLPRQRAFVTLDGEREFALREENEVAIWLDTEGPLTIDIPGVMRLAAADGMFNHLSRFFQKDSFHAQN